MRTLAYRMTRFGIKGLPFMGVCTIPFLLIVPYEIWASGTPRIWGMAVTLSGAARFEEMQEAIRRQNWSAIFAITNWWWPFIVAGILGIAFAPKPYNVLFALQTWIVPIFLFFGWVGSEIRRMRGKSSQNATDVDGTVLSPVLPE